MTLGPPVDVGGDVLVGTLLAGRYRVLRKLGEGAMGSVYLGEHVRMGRRDAIKVLRPALADDAEAVARFERGARNASSIHHPNVCTVYDFGDAEGGRRFLSMEYVPGERLQDLLKREGTLPPARAVDIAAQVASALQAAHDHGIVHRDLKPANVMVAPARGGGDTVKVVDFDIAKGSAQGSGADLTRLGYVIGTPEYMSPEQLLGLPLDGRSDVYSLALVLFEMLVGHLPGGAQDTQQRVLRRLAGTPPPLEEGFATRGTPPALRKAIARGLQPRPEDRDPGAVAFARAILDALADPGGDIAGPGPVFATPGATLSISAPSGHPDTRGGIPRTRVAVEQVAEDVAGGPVARVLASIPWLATLVLVAVVAAGAAWSVTRWLNPSPIASETVAVDSPETTEEMESGPNPVVVSDSARPVPPLDPPVEPTDRTDPGRVSSMIRSAGDQAAVTAGSNGPVVTSPDPTPAAPDASTVLDRLEDRVGPPYPSEAELRRVRDAAQDVWDQGARLGPVSRARAAFVLAHAALGMDDAEGCVRWAEIAVSLRSGGARQVLLDECRRVRG